MRSALFVLMLQVPLFGMAINAVPPIELRYDDLTSTEARPIQIVRELGEIAEVELSLNNGHKTYRINTSRAIQYRRCLHGKILQARGTLPDPTDLSRDALFGCLKGKIQQDDAMAVRHLVPRAYQTDREALKRLLESYGQRGSIICAFEYARVRLRDTEERIAKVPEMVQEMLVDYRNAMNDPKWSDLYTQAKYDVFYGEKKRLEQLYLLDEAVHEFARQIFFAQALIIIDLVRCVYPASLPKIEALIKQWHPPPQLTSLDYIQDMKAYIEHLQEKYSITASPKDDDLQKYQQVVSMSRALNSMAVGIQQALTLAVTRDAPSAWFLHMLPQEDVLPGARPLTDAHKKTIVSVLRKRIDATTKDLPEEVLEYHEDPDDDPDRTKTTLGQLEAEFDNFFSESATTGKGKLKYD